MTEALVTTLKCLYPDCGHEWVPRTNRKPLVCPRCKRYNWDVGIGAKKTRGGKKHAVRAKRRSRIDLFKEEFKRKKKED